MAEETPTPAKPWYLSKTLLINLLALLGTIIPPVGQFYADNPEISMSILAVANAILRTLTKKKLEIS